MQSLDQSKSGTLVTWLTLPWPWPPVSEIVLTRGTLGANVVLCRALADGRLSMQILYPATGTALLDLVSCPVIVTEPGLVMLGLVWDVAALAARIHINEAVVASTNPNDVTVQIYEVPPLKSLAAEDLHDFSRENAAARKAREGAVGRSGTRSGRLPGSPATVFDSLREEVAQVESLVRLLDGGALYHARGLANSIGLLLADGRPVPLIQLAAAITGSSLMVYTVARPETEVPLSPNATVSFDVSPAPSRLHPNPIDIDVWLQLKGVSLGGTNYTNREVIKAIRNTRGSHADRDLHPLVEMLRSTRSAAVGGLEYDLLVHAVRNISIVAVSLGRTIIAKYETTN